MKKIIALLLCACVLLLAGCGGADDSAETTVAAPEGYVGEGLLTSLKVLVYSNEYFVNDVFTAACPSHTTRALRRSLTSITALPPRISPITLHLRAPCSPPIPSRRPRSC